MQGFHIASILFLLNLFILSSLCFDTGHHQDVTRNALRHFGFSKTSANVAFLQNFMVDFYSQQSNPLFDGAEDQAEFKKLHFDNLFSFSQVSNYWDWLCATYSKAVLKMKSNPQATPLDFLTLIGASLHAVQDFYAHSTWVEMHYNASVPRNIYYINTWYHSALKKNLNNTNFYTGYTEDYAASFPNQLAGKVPHGKYDVGLNKDSYVCENWDRSYIMAFTASIEWLLLTKNLLATKWWNRIRYFELSSAVDIEHLEYGLQAAYRISEWSTNSGSNGHWKGFGSGSSLDLNTFGSAFYASDFESSVFVQEFSVKKLHLLLTTNLTGDVIAPPCPKPPRFWEIERKRVVVVRTTKVQGISGMEFSGDDYFANITFDNIQGFVEAMQIDSNTIQPYWTSMFLTVKSLVNITYELLEEDSISSNDVIDINPRLDAKALSFSYLLKNSTLYGDITGIHNTTTTAVSVQGTVNPAASVQFYVETRYLKRQYSLFPIGN